MKERFDSVFEADGWRSVSGYVGCQGRTRRHRACVGIIPELWVNTPRGGICFNIDRLLPVYRTKALGQCSARRYLLQY